MTRLRYFPMIVGIMCLVLFFFAFNPMVAFLEYVGCSALMSRLAATLVIIIPCFFLFGINSGKKVFLWIVALLGIVLAIGFFLL